MNATFLDELAKKLAERWLTLLVLPGLVYVTITTVAGVLGQAHATDLHALRAWADTVAAAPASRSPAVVLATATGILIAAAGAGLVATALGRLTERGWTATGQRLPAGWLTTWRRRRWDRAYASLRAILQAKTTQACIPTRSDAPVAPACGLNAAVEECTRICLVPADRPTWIGDRLRAADERIYRAYRLDVSAAWPRLWVLIPDAARTELGAAHDAYTAAARLNGWALLYLTIGPWWWPALAIATASGVSAWIRGRAATAVLADLVESTVDLYGPDLARQLGITCATTLTPEVGHEVTKTLRKDDTLHPGQPARTPLRETKAR